MRKIGSHPMPEQKRDIALRCLWLQDKVDAFQRQAESILHAVSNDADNSWGDEDTREAYTGTKFDGIGEEDNDGVGSAAEDCYQLQSLRNR